MEILLIVLFSVLAFEYAALRWGHDSRDGFRARRHY